MAPSLPPQPAPPVRRRKARPCDAAALAEIERARSLSLPCGSRSACAGSSGAARAHRSSFARYGARVSIIFRCDLETAIAVIEVQYQGETRRFGHEAALGAGQRLSTMVLAEMRLDPPSFMRAKRLGLQPVIADVLGEAFAEAAE